MKKFGYLFLTLLLSLLLNACGDTSSTSLPTPTKQAITVAPSAKPVDDSRLIIKQLEHFKKNECALNSEGNITKIPVDVLKSMLVEVHIDIESSLQGVGTQEPYKIGRAGIIDLGNGDRRLVAAFHVLHEAASLLNDFKGDAEKQLGVGALKNFKSYVRIKSDTEIWRIPLDLNNYNNVGVPFTWLFHGDKADDLLISQKIPANIFPNIKGIPLKAKTTLLDLTEKNQICDKDIHVFAVLPEGEIVSVKYTGLLGKNLYYDSKGYSYDNLSFVPINPSKAIGPTSSGSLTVAQLADGSFIPLGVLSGDLPTDKINLAQAINGGKLPYTDETQPSFYLTLAKIFD